MVAGPLAPGARQGARRAPADLRAESGRVRAVFNGHLHWNHLDVIAGIPYVTVQSLIENLDDDAPGRPAAAHAVVRADRRGGWRSTSAATTRRGIRSSGERAVAPSLVVGLGSSVVPARARACSRRRGHRAARPRRSAPRPRRPRAAPRPAPASRPRPRRRRVRAGSRPRPALAVPSARATPIPKYACPVVLPAAPFTPSSPPPTPASPSSTATTCSPSSTARRPAPCLPTTRLAISSTCTTCRPRTAGECDGGARRACAATPPWPCSPARRDARRGHPRPRRVGVPRLRHAVLGLRGWAAQGARRLLRGDRRRARSPATASTSSGTTVDLFTTEWAARCADGRRVPQRLRLHARRPVARRQRVALRLRRAVPDRPGRPEGRLALRGALGPRRAHRPEDRVQARALAPALHRRRTPRRATTTRGSRAVPGSPDEITLEQWLRAERGLVGDAELPVCDGCECGACATLAEDGEKTPCGEASLRLDARGRVAAPAEAPHLRRRHVATRRTACVAVDVKVARAGAHADAAPRDGAGRADVRRRRDVRGARALPEHAPHAATPTCPARGASRSSPCPRPPPRPAGRGAHRSPAASSRRRGTERTWCSPQSQAKRR